MGDICEQNMAETIEKSGGHTSSGIEIHGRLDKLSYYHLNRRRKRFKKKRKLRSFSIAFRKIIHPVLYGVIKADRFLSKEGIVILGDRCNHNNVIYAVTHIGGNDVQRAFEAIRDHAYLLLGDPGDLYKNVVGLLLYLNGVICLETRDKTDRKIAYARSIELLQKGGSLVVFPEGAWNIEPSLPVMHLFPGVIRMAKTTGCAIVPIASEVYENRYVIYIGKAYKLDGMEDDEKIQVAELRDILATLKWEIWESQGIYCRKDQAVVSDKEFAQAVIDRVDWGYTLQDVYETRYHDF